MSCACDSIFYKRLNLNPSHFRVANNFRFTFPTLIFVVIRQVGLKGIRTNESQSECHVTIIYCCCCNVVSSVNAVVGCFFTCTWHLNPLAPFPHISSFFTHSNRCKTVMIALCCNKQRFHQSLHGLSVCFQELSPALSRR